MDKRIIKTIRFTTEEVRKIDSFIEKNDFLDFSTVVRMAVTRFLENPEIAIRNKNRNIKFQKNQSVRIEH